ncbi:MAG: 2-dehydro-3-deoxygalactonokinase, partial [Thermomonas sp.]
MIAVDWGTSSLRLYRLDPAGMVLERRRSDEGVLASSGRFGEVLARGIDGWDDHDLLLCGMVGGRGGWHEVPYLDCPAGIAELADG